jgi:hypothetical protein
MRAPRALRQGYMVTRVTTHHLGVLTAGGDMLHTSSASRLPKLLAPGDGGGSGEGRRAAATAQPREGTRWLDSGEGGEAFIAARPELLGMRRGRNRAGEPASTSAGERCERIGNNPPP